MLRYAFLPSDFHPQFLILGEREDLRDLAEMLRHVAPGKPAIPVPAQPPHDPFQAASLRLEWAPQPLGLRLSDPDENLYSWTLSASAASGLADQLAALASSVEPAGSVMFERVGQADIPVKVSRGEYTDAFLITEF